MSITINFKDLSGNDLGSIFMGLSGLGYDTVYKDINDIDFSQLFMPLGGAACLNGSGGNAGANVMIYIYFQYP